jgi:hypothetical protein
MPNIEPAVHPAPMRWPTSGSRVLAERHAHHAGGAHRQADRLRPV